MNPVIDGILALEGGYTNNPHDRGGETHWGITEATARANGYNGEMKALTRDEAYAILEAYWIKPGFEMSRISPGRYRSNCATRRSISARVSPVSGYSVG